MISMNQGDIIRISGYNRKLFVVVSKNAFNKATGVFHVCPLAADIPEGPLHIPVSGVNSSSGTVLCEQIKLIDPSARGCSRIDHLSYHDTMNVSDAIQGVFEYD